MGLSYKHFLYGAVTFTSLLAAFLIKGLFGAAVGAAMAFSLVVLYFVFLAWAGGQLWTIHLREQRQLELERGTGVTLPEEDRPNEQTLFAAESYLSLGEKLETICQFVNPRYRDWDPSKQLNFRQSLNSLLAERQSQRPEPGEPQ